MRLLSLLTLATLACAPAGDDIYCYGPTLPAGWAELRGELVDAHHAREPLELSAGDVTTMKARFSEYLSLRQFEWARRRGPLRLDVDRIGQLVRADDDDRAERIPSLGLTDETDRLVRDGRIWWVHRGAAWRVPRLELGLARSQVTALSFARAPQDAAFRDWLRSAVRGQR